MPPADPAAYTWLSTSALQEAGCVTVVAGADPAPVAEAFGHDPGDVGDGDDTGIWVVASEGATVVFEINGFEGTREEVLRDASRLGETRTAASLFWNVNGIVQVTCARRGKVVASVDLSVLDEEDLAEVPRALRRLARLCLDEDVDALAVGAAMVETYVGAGFTQRDLGGSTMLPIVARPADLETYDHEAGRAYGPLHDLPGVRDAIHAMPPEHQRARGVGRERGGQGGGAGRRAGGADGARAARRRRGRDPAPRASRR